jgi:hypothetical protein
LLKFLEELEGNEDDALRLTKEGACKLLKKLLTLQ